MRSGRESPVGRKAFERICVSDGNEALAVFKDRADRIGLVILDARMPGPLPVELHKQIRQIRPCAPILFCSGVSPDDPLIRAINDYGLRLLPKPFNRSELFEAILNILKHSDAGVPTPA